MAPPSPATGPSSSSPAEEVQEQEREQDRISKEQELEQPSQHQQQDQQGLHQPEQQPTGEKLHAHTSGPANATTTVVDTAPTSTAVDVAPVLISSTVPTTLPSFGPLTAVTVSRVSHPIPAILSVPDLDSATPIGNILPVLPTETPTDLSNGHAHGQDDTATTPASASASSTAPVPAVTAVTSGDGHVNENDNKDGSGNGQRDSVSSTAAALMSNPLPQDHSRQHVNYPGQAAYSAPSTMSPAPYGYPVVTSHAVDPYRVPSQPPPPPNPSLALPSMRSLDPLQQQQQHHHAQAMSMAAPIATAYYAQPGIGMPPYGIHQGYPMGVDPRVAMSGGRHKKEIKRRTKTGCLTCRKRRIKCDETQPTCNNCKKSKRECAGYDPIFKQAQQQAPSAIQPALNHSPASSSLSGAASALSTYGTQPSVVPSNYPPTTHGLPFDPALASNVEYPGTIDPALDPATGAPAAHHHITNPVNAAHYRAKRMKVDELVALGGPSPPPLATPPSKDILDEIIKIYYEVYVPGLSAFFESHWYNFKPDGPNSIKILQDNKPLMDLLVSFLNSLTQIRSTTDSAQMANTGNLETRVVWGLTTLAYSVPAGTNPHSDEPLPQDNAIETRSRLTVFEALLSGTALTTNPCVQPPKNGDPHRIREFEFWYYLAEYLRLAGDGSSGQPATSTSSSTTVVNTAMATTQMRDAALTRIRSLLDGRENRDVLYSIAILRELSPLFPPGYESQVPQHLDESEPRNRLAVASQFIREEARTPGGTTNVVRRFAELAAKAFISPGANVARRA